MHVVERAVEKTETCLVGVGSLDLRQDLCVPFRDGILDNRSKSGAPGDLTIHIIAGLLRGYPGDTDARDHLTILKGEERTYSCRTRLGRDIAIGMLDALG